MDSERRENVSISVVAAVLALIFIAVAAIPAWYISRLSAVGDQIVYSVDPAIDLAQSIENAMIDAETGARGYLLSGGMKPFLEPYEQGIRRLAEAWGGAEVVMPKLGGEAVTAKVLEVRSRASAWQEYADEQVRLVDRGLFEEAVQRVRTVQGKSLFDAFRVEIGELHRMLGAEKSRLVGERERLYSAVNTAMIGIAAFGLLSLFLLYFMQAFSRRSLRRSLELEKENKLKDNFIHLAGHELRTPVAALAINLQLLERHIAKFRKQLEPPDGSEVIADFDRRMFALERQNKKLTLLVHQLDDMNRLEGDFALRTEPFDLAAVLGKLVRVDVPVLLPDTKFVFINDAARPEVEADQSKIEQVFLNLASNAAKFSTGSAPVRIYLSETPERVTFSMTNQGARIPPGDEDRIFERYYRAANVNALQTSGLGLGLFISRQIVEASGGRIWAASTETGTTFYVSLPRAHSGVRV